RARILEQTGLTASAGVSYNKFHAKLASDQRKPNGQFVVTPGQGPSFIEALPVERFHGVGPVTAERMQTLGIHTGADLKRQTLAFLEEHFGKAGAWYYSIARGEDGREVVPNRERKSSGSETTFSEDLFAPADIEAGICAMADDVWAWCEKTATYGYTVAVKVKYVNFRLITRRRTLSSPVMTQAKLQELSMALVRTVYPVTVSVRLVGVSVSNLAGVDQVIPQLELGLLGEE
ncbi:MAG: DNA polymerase IV, partial [Thermomicrobiales bacterium]